MGTIKILRRVTGTVKLFPFCYTAVLLLFWLVAPALSEAVITEIDSAIYLSALMAAFLIRLSYCVRLCVWHRLQCVLPLFPQAVAKIDAYVCEFGVYMALINYVVTWCVFAISLVNAYKVFIKPTVRK